MTQQRPTQPTRHATHQSHGTTTPVKTSQNDTPHPNPHGTAPPDAPKKTRPPIPTTPRHHTQSTRHAAHQSPQHTNTRHTQGDATPTNPHGTATLHTTQTTCSPPIAMAQCRGHTLHPPIPTAQQCKTPPHTTHLAPITMAHRGGHDAPPTNPPGATTRDCTHTTRIHANHNGTAHRAHRVRA